jgi:predicted alpha/beta superfamily hydrolase
MMNAKPSRRRDVSKRLFLFLVPWLLGALALHSFAEETVKVTITVTVPKDTPKNATLYLAGDMGEVGAWKAQGAKLTRQDDGTYKVELKLTKGQNLEYKINGGSWETVEKGKDGEEVENRWLALNGDKDEKITVAAWAHAPGTSDENKSSITGDVRKHVKFASKILNNERTILVWLPPGYDPNQSTRYPVLYLHDGQNCFDAATSFAGEWRADETATELISAGKIKPIIIVAIANAGAQRMDEYTPTRDTTRGAGGKGELYARFIVEEVKPFIDTTYRTLKDRENTAVAGSSLGGLISLYLGYKYSDVFSMCGVMSPSLFWDNEQLLRSIRADSSAIKREKIWLDTGTAEGNEAVRAVENVEALTEAMKTAGLAQDRDFVSRKYEGAEHNEKAWAARFGDVLRFFFAN